MRPSRPTATSDGSASPSDRMNKGRSSAVGMAAHTPAAANMAISSNASHGRPAAGLLLVVPLGRIIGFLPPTARIFADVGAAPGHRAVGAGQDLGGRRRLVGAHQARLVEGAVVLTLVD